jgi:hypothetical protein
VKEKDKQVRGTIFLLLCPFSKKKKKVGLLTELEAIKTISHRCPQRST